MQWFLAYDTWYTTIIKYTFVTGIVIRKNGIAGSYKMESNLGTRQNVKQEPSQCKLETVFRFLKLFLCNYL